MFRGLRYFNKNMRTEEEINNASIHNLNLYLNFVENNFPNEFQIMEEHFDGLPSYSGINKEEI